MSIALDVLGPSLMAQAAAQSVDPALLHRVVSVATGGLDTLPHNGAVITLLGICGMTHRQAYGDIFMVATVLAPIIAWEACGSLIICCWEADPCSPSRSDPPSDYGFRFRIWLRWLRRSSRWNSGAPPDVLNGR
jgi:hypothetical protein